MSWLARLCASGAQASDLSSPAQVPKVLRADACMQTSITEVQNQQTKSELLSAAEYSVTKPSSPEQPAASFIEQGVAKAFSTLTLVPSGQPLYRRINILLEACRVALGACDARLACFSGDGDTFVFLPCAAGVDAPPRGAGWGRTALWSFLADQPDSIVVIRGYHSSPSVPGGAVANMTSVEAAGATAGGGCNGFGRQGSSLTPTAGNSNNAAAAALCASPLAAASSAATGAATTAATMDKSAAAVLPLTTQSPRSHHGLSSSHGASSATNSLAAMAMRTAPPDPFSLVCRSAATAANLQPGDLLALPVRHGGRLVAALLLGWGIHGCTAAGAAGPEPAPTAVAADEAVLAAGNLQKPAPNNMVTAASLLKSATRGNGDSAGHGLDATGSTAAAPAPAVEALVQPVSTEPQPSSSGMTLTPGELGHLSRLAQLLVFGLYAEPQHARTLETVAASLSSLPYCTGLHDFVAGLLEAVPELLQIRFSLRFSPIMLLTHGLGASGPAVLFSSRSGGAQQGQQQQQQGAGVAAAAAVMAGDGSLGTMELFPQTLGSAAASTRPADGGDTSAVVSRVRAVRMSLHHTLLAEALKPAAKLRRSVEITTTGPAPTGTGGGGGGAGGQVVGHPQFMPFSAVSSHYAVTGPQLPSIAINSAIDEGVNENQLPTGGPGVVGAGPPSALPPPLPLPVIPSTQPIYFTVVPNISTHMLEEGAPCRDLLLCANLAGCAMGSLVLAVEAPAPSASGAAAGSTAAGGGNPPTAPGAMTAMAASGSVGAGAQGAGLAATGAYAAPAAAGGVSNSATGFVGLANASTHRGSFNNLLSTAGSIPAPVLLTAPLSVLHSSRQFGMYLVCNEPLPAPLLQLVAAELQQLLEMVLGACREGVLSLLGGGRCAVELYSLQEQLLGNNSAAAGGSAAIAGHIAGAMAAALSAPSPLATGPAGATAPQAVSAAMGAGALIASRSGLGPGNSARQALARSFAAPHGRAIPRSLYHLAAGALPMGSGGGAGGGVGSVGVGLNTTGADQFSGAVRSAGSPRLQLSQMGQSALLATQRNMSTRGGGGAPGAVAAAGALLMSHQGHMHGHTPGHGEGLDGSVESLAQGVSGVDADGGMCWMLASSPEVMLEPPGAGPSPLEVMVSSMRTGLTAALTNAMVLDSSDEAKAAMNQELAAIRLYDVIGRGGQGVVFHGTLHGLETAVKVIVHRGKGEPLAHDGGDPVAGGAEGSGADAGAAAAAAGAADAAGGADGADGRNSAGDLSRIRKAKRGALELVVTGTLSSPHIVQVLASFSDVIMVRCTYRNEPTPRLRLVAKDDPILAGWASPGPLNTVACLEYCDAGTLLEAAHAGAFRPPGSSVLSGAVRPALVPLYMSLLEVALALRYLHNRRLVHCDLKPANVLLKSSSRDPRGWTCKLSDFGCVRLMTELPATPEDLAAMQQQQQAAAAAGGRGGAAAALSGRGGARPGAAGANAAGFNLKKTVMGFRVAQPLGTIAYMSPESFIRGHTLGPGVDVYAFGILMYELLMCRAPYQGIDAQALPRMVLRQNLRPEFHPLAPPEYCHLAARCWSSSVTRRPSTVQLVSEIEALLAEAQLKESRKASMQPRPGAPSGPPAGAGAPAPQAVRPPQAGAAGVPAPLPALPAIPASKPSPPTPPAQPQSPLALPASSASAAGSGAAVGGVQERALPTRVAQGSSKPGAVGPPVAAAGAAGVSLQPPSAAAAGVTPQPEPRPAIGATPSQAAPVAAAAAEPQVALASIEPAAPEINELVTAAAAAAGLDATVEVLQVKVPPGAEPAADVGSPGL